VSDTRRIRYSYRVRASLVGIQVRIPTDNLKIKYIGNIWKILFGQQLIKIVTS